MTDAGERAALAVVRSLGRAGHEVVAGERSLPSLASSSRFCTRSIRLPHPLEAPHEFADALLSAAVSEGVDMLLPVTDESLGIALEHRMRFEERGIHVPFADYEAYTAISDKRRVLERAKALGIAAPPQVVVQDPGAADELDASSLSFPLVVKPSRSVIGGRGSRRKATVLHAATPAQLNERLRALDPAAYPLLLQERIVGPGVGVFLLRWNGAVVAAFAHRRIREKPPSGGVSVLRESYPLDGDLYRLSAALLEQHDWRGPAMIEYKVSQESGTPYLMEVNGRYWGSLQLAIDAGVDFPALHVAVADGRHVEPVLEYPAGVATRWFLGDVDHLLTRLRRSPEELGLSPSSPGRGRAALDFVRDFRPGVHSEVFRWSDPIPGLVELGRWLRRAV